MHVKQINDDMLRTAVKTVVYRMQLLEYKNCGYIDGNF